MKNFRIIYIVMLVFVAGFMSCSENEWDDHVGGSDGAIKADLLQQIKSNPDLTIFARAIEKTGYNLLLEQASNFTVFAPQNSAWSGIDTNNIESLKKIVSYQIAYGKNISTDAVFMSKLKMVNTKYVRFNSSSQTLEGAKIISADKVAGNGVIHIVDKPFELKDNVFDYILSNFKNTELVKHLESMNTKVMDEERSVQTGVNDLGQLEYDTIWVDVNPFLTEYPINNEDSLVTFILLEDDGFDYLKSKYMPYFKQQVDSLTEPLVKENICRDMVISLNKVVDLTAVDTIINVDGVKVPINGSNIKSTYEASNGRVYVISKSDILLKNKIQSIRIEGENYLSSSSNSNLYVRFRRWASGERDIMLNCRFVQTDNVTLIGSQGQDSIISENKTFFWDNNTASLANAQNFHIRYQAPVNSVDYEIHYVAYDDIDWHYEDTNHIFRFDQKLFISMPGQPELAYTSANGVANNYLGDLMCFVAQDTAGIYKERKMTKWNLGANTTQYITTAVKGDDASIMSVPASGNLTMWLCNTAKTNATQSQGMLFLDYILLVPKLPAE
ncbi:fasciclin domain-containing protein [Dysgonomonas macrotermitis]|nr:fasciclin domain-containing protein [Dysgonomonas macrotermitis]